MPLKDYKEVQWYRGSLRAQVGLGFIAVDAQVFIPFIFWVLFPSWWTFGVLSLVVLFFLVLKFFGYSVPVAMKRLRAKIAGRRRYVRQMSKKRRRFVHGGQ